MTTQIIPTLTASGVEVTVSYEALNSAAEQVLQNTGRLHDACEEMHNLNGKLPSFWESDVCDEEKANTQELLDELFQICEHFRQHAANLQSIAQNYLKTSGEVNAVVQSLSSDVLV